MKSVVFVDDAHTFGGAQIALRNIIGTLLASEKYRIILFSTSKNTSKILAGDMHNKVRAYSIPSAKRLNIFSFLFSLVGAYRALSSELKNESNIWILNLSGIEFCLSSLLILQLRRRTPIAWLHNSRAFAELLPNAVGFRRTLNGFRDRIADRVIFPTYRQIIVPSHSERSFLSRRIRSLGHVCVVRNPIFPQTELSAYRVPERWAAAPTAALGLRIYVIGRIEFSTKGQDKCVSICRALAARGTATHFVFVGDGPDADALRSCFSEAGLASRLTISGWTDRPFDQITADDIVLIPSNFESSSLVAAESMSRGLRIVASPLSVFRETIPSVCIADSEAAPDYGQRIISIRSTSLYLLRAMYQDKLRALSAEAIEESFSSVLRLSAGWPSDERSIQ